MLLDPYGCCVKLSMLNIFLMLNFDFDGLRIDEFELLFGSKSEVLEVLEISIHKSSN